MYTEALIPFVKNHRDIKIRGEYSAELDLWVTHFDLPRREGGFQTVIHKSMDRPHGPARVTGPTAEAALAAAISEIDRYLDRT